jgi:hypothetical protein
MPFSMLNVKNKSAGHVHLAMSEIDDVHDAQDESEADPDERIGAPDDQPVDKILQENGHGIRSAGEKRQMIPRPLPQPETGGPNRKQNKFLLYFM